MKVEELRPGDLICLNKMHFSSPIIEAGTFDVQIFREGYTILSGPTAPVPFGTPGLLLELFSTNRGHVKRAKVLINGNIVQCEAYLWKHMPAGPHELGAC